MKHNDLQKKVANELARFGNGFNIVGSNKRGRPDIYGHIGIMGIGVEVKVGKDCLRSQQRATLRDILDKGGIGIVVHEKYFPIFQMYVEYVAQQIKADVPVSKLGKPIPAELYVEDFKDRAVFSAESI